MLAHQLKPLILARQRLIDKPEGGTTCESQALTQGLSTGPA
jgi:hypothetical protein